MITVDSEIKTALTKKGYQLENTNIKIESVWGYIHRFKIYLNGKFVEMYDAKEKKFID